MLCKDYEIPQFEKWYKYTAEPVVRTKNVMALWNFALYTDRKIDANRPDIIMKGIRVLDVTVPANENILL